MPNTQTNDAAATKVTLIHKTFKNGKLRLPIEGEVTIANGQVEVSQACADVMLTDPINWTTQALLDAASARTANRLANAAASTGEAAEVDALDPDTISMLKTADWDNMPLEEVTEIANALGIKNWIKFQKNEEALRKYIANRVAAILK